MFLALKFKVALAALTGFVTPLAVAPLVLGSPTVYLEFMRQAENFDPTSGPVSVEPIAYDSFFPGGAKPSEEVVAFVNDAARTNGLFEPVLEREAASFNANGKSAAEILAGQDEIILSFDFARATASANAYLQAGGDPRAFMAATMSFWIWSIKGMGRL